MLTGCDGRLVSGAFLERESASLADTASMDERRHTLIAWSERTRGLGPASTPAAMLQMSAAPLIVLLGFEALARVELMDSPVAATVTGGAAPVAIVVSGYAEPLDPLWRLAVTQATLRSAGWCLLFDGLHLRIVDASRLDAQRYLQFDLEELLENKDAFAAFWRTFSAAALTAAP